MKTKKLRYTISFGLLAVVLCVFFIWNIRAGSVLLNGREIGEILFSGKSDDTAWHIIWDIRMPRILAVVILGGALSVSGFFLQTFFANPIAGPFVLGISSGARLVVAMVMIGFISRGCVMGSGGMILAAFVGSMISMGFVLLIARKVKNMSVLVVCGVMMGYICTAVTDFAVTFADDANIVNLHNWSVGSFSGMSWESVEISGLIVAVCLFVSVFLAKPMEAYQLGEVYAKSLGVPVKRFAAELILLSSLLSACVTAFAGPISFVGIAVPHLIKKLFGTAKPMIMIPGCFLGGGVFCLLCDMIARTAFAPVEVSISSVTAVFGAPIVIYIMINSRKHR